MVLVLPVHSLTLVVHVLVVCVEMLLYVCESIKFEGGTDGHGFVRQYFQLSNCGDPPVQ